MTELIVCPLCPDWKYKVLTIKEEKIPVRHKICDNHWKELVNRFGEEGAKKKAKVLRYFMLFGESILYLGMAGKSERECLIEALDMIKESLRKLPSPEEITIDFAKISSADKITIHFPDETITVTKELKVKKERKARKRRKSARER